MSNTTDLTHNIENHDIVFNVDDDEIDIDIDNDNDNEGSGPTMAALSGGRKLF